MGTLQEDPALASVSCLNDPVRGQLYEFVCHSPEPVGRDEAAAAAGIGRAIAVYHLDKLVESGLLTATYRRPAGRGGPGAGRPAKFYARSEREFTVTVPPREYELAADLLAQAVAADPGGASQAALHAAARQFGAEAGARHRARLGGGGADAGERPGARAGGGGADAGERDGPQLGQGDSGAGERHGAQVGGDGAAAGGRHAGDGSGDDPARVTAVLRAHGFDPWPGADGRVLLRNCPFRRLAARHREIVCGMNLALIEGLVAGLGAGGMHPELDPGAGQCCVVIRTGPPPAGTKTGAR